MCFRIKRYANYVPIPKQLLCTPDQGLEELKTIGHGWQCDDDHVWNQQDGAGPEDKRRRFLGGPVGYEQSHDVS